MRKIKIKSIIQDEELTSILKDEMLLRIGVFIRDTKMIPVYRENNSLVASCYVMTENEFERIMEILSQIRLRFELKKDIKKVDRLKKILMGKLEGK